MRVDVLHNTHPDAPSRGFTATDRLVDVQQFDVEESHDHEALTQVLWLTSVAHRADATSGRPDEQAVRYRAAGHRALRTGDVVVVGDRAWAHARVGWTPLRADALTAAAAATATTRAARAAARRATTRTATAKTATAKTATAKTATARTATTRTARDRAAEGRTTPARSAPALDARPAVA